MELKKQLDAFIQNPVQILTFFIIVNLIPAIGLVFTEPLDLWGKIVLILFPAGLYCLLFTALRNIGLTQLLLIPLLVIHAFQIVVFYLFGEGVIAVDMFLNVVTTNVNEAGEVLQGILVSVIFVVMVYVPTIVIAALAFRKKTQLSNTLRRKTAGTGVILLIMSGLAGGMAINRDTLRFTLYEDVYPANVFYNLSFARQKWVRSKQYPETSRLFTFDAVRRDTTLQQREIYVLVIGETSRAGNWGLYGYERNTTPHLACDTNLVVMTDALTQSNTTHKSVSIMLTPASAGDYGSIYGQKSIITAFKEAGFTTLFLSNQSANRTFTDYFAQEADYCKYFRFFNENTNNYDDVLLTELQHCLDTMEGNLFVVLHTYGSHFNYHERYPEEFSVFRPDNFHKVNRANRDMLVNAYDNTILYTDYFLHRLTGMLQATNSCTAFFYSSDHGEDIMDDRHQRFLHASPNPSFYQLHIPMLMWFSPVYKEYFPTPVAHAYSNSSKPVTTNTIFHTLLDIARIGTPFCDATLSLLNEQFNIVPRMYLGDHDEPVPFYRAGLKPEDKIMLQTHHIAH